MHLFTLIFILEGIALFVIVLATANVFKKKKKRHLSITFAIGMITYLFISLFISSDTEITKNQEFENWAKVNQIKYTNGQTNLEVSEWKTYESIMHGDVEYREILE